MKERLKLIVDQFELHNRLFKNALEGLEAERELRPRESTNHIAWLAGHIVSARHTLGNLLGLDIKEPHPDLYQHGKGLSPEAEYPSLERSVKDWEEVTPKLLDSLKSINPEQLTARGPFTVPMGDTIEQWIAFMAHHEAYHIGQISILRRYFGKEAMKYS